MERLRVQGEWLIDGTGRPPVRNGAVLLEGDRILAVGSPEEVPAAAEAVTIDCRGEVLLPGLIDCHNHLAMDTTLMNWPARLNDGVPELTLRAANNMAIDLKAGVTTARSLGDKDFLDIAVKRAIAEGRLAGPRLRVATRGLRATHGHGLVAYPVDGPDPLRAAVRENLLAGADLIKLFITGTVRSGRELPSFLSPEEIGVGVREAHRRGVPVTVHCIGGGGLQDCLEGGVDCIEHGFFLSDPEIELLLKSGRWLVLTPGLYLAEERMCTLPAALADGFRRGRAEAAERMGAAIRAGVKFAVGTDGAHGQLARDVALLVQMGASEESALAAATRNAAAVLGMSDQVGTLEPGKAADVIGVQGDPLQDICALEKVQTVISRGRLFVAKGKETAKG